MFLMRATTVLNCHDVEHGLALPLCDGLSGCLQGLMLLSAFTATCGCYVRGLVGWKFLELFFIRTICIRPLIARRQSRSNKGRCDKLLELNCRCPSQNVAQIASTPRIEAIQPKTTVLISPGLHWGFCCTGPEEVVGWETLMGAAVFGFKKTAPSCVLDVISWLVTAPDALARLTVAFRDPLRVGL